MAKHGEQYNRLILLICVFAIAGCELEKVAPLELTPILPVVRTISDTRGRSMDAKIISRNSESVTFIRLSDSKTFTYPISQLSPDDQSFVVKLPITVAENQQTFSKDQPKGQGVLVFLEARLKIVDAEIKEMSARSLQTDPFSIAGRSLKRDIEKLKTEKSKLLKEIAEAKN